MVRTGMLAVWGDNWDVAHVYCFQRGSPEYPKQNHWRPTFLAAFVAAEGVERPIARVMRNPRTNLDG